MLGNSYDSQVCSIARSLELIGERWSLLIIRDALFGNVRRFSDFQQRLGIATNVLTARLESFLASGIMRRSDIGEYILTRKGRELAVALIALTEWGDVWASSIEPPILYHHADCGGGAVHTVAICGTCGPVPAGEVAVTIGPGMPQSASSH